MILSSLQSDNALQMYIDSAKSYYEKYKANLESEFQKNIEKPMFLKNLGISILANLLYSIFVIIVFIVAKDQISSWLVQLTQK